MPKYFPVTRVRIVQQSTEVLYEGDVFSRLEFHQPPIESEDTLLISDLLEYMPISDDGESTVVATVTEYENHVVPDDFNTLKIGSDLEDHPIQTESMDTLVASNNDIHPTSTDQSSAAISLVNELHPTSNENASVVVDLEEEYQPTSIDDQSIWIPYTDYQPHPIDENFILAIAFADEYQDNPIAEETLDVWNMEESVHPDSSDENSAIFSQLTEYHPISDDENSATLSTINETHPLPVGENTIGSVNVDDVHPTPSQVDVAVKIGEEIVAVIPFDDLRMLVENRDNQPHPTDNVDSYGKPIGVDTTTHPIAVEDNTILAGLVNEDQPDTSEDINIRAEATYWANAVASYSNFSSTGNATDRDVNTAATASVSSSGFGGLTSNTSNIRLDLTFPDFNIYWLNIIEAEFSYKWETSNSNALAGTAAGHNVTHRYSFNNGSSWTNYQTTTGRSGDGEHTIDILAATGGQWDSIDDFRFGVTGNITSGAGTLVVTSTQSFNVFYSRMYVVAELDAEFIPLLYDYLDDSSGNNHRMSQTHNNGVSTIAADSSISKFVEGKDFTGISQSAFVNTTAVEMDSSNISLTLVCRIDTVPESGFVDYVAKFGTSTGPGSVFSLYFDGSSDTLVFNYGMSSGPTQVIPIVVSPTNGTIYKIAINREVVGGDIVTRSSVNGVDNTPHVYTTASTVISEPSGILTVFQNNNAPSYSNVPDGSVYDARFWNYAKPIDELNRILENVGTDNPRLTETACYRFRDISEELSYEYFDWSGHDADVIEAGGNLPSDIAPPSGFEKWGAGKRWNDTNNQQLERTTPLLYLTGDMALTCVFRLHAIGDLNDILLHYNNNSNYDNSAFALVVRRNGSNNELVFSSNGGSVDAGRRFTISSDLDLNTVYSVAISRNNITKEIEASLNGTPVTTYTYTGEIVPFSDGVFSVGGSIDGGAVPNVDIFDVRVWDYAKPLNQMHLILDQTQGLDITRGDELVHYRFYDPIPQTKDFLFDSTGNGFDLSAGTQATSQANPPTSVSKFVSGRTFTNTSGEQLTIVNDAFNLNNDMALFVVLRGNSPSDQDYIVGYGNDGNGNQRPWTLVIQNNSLRFRFYDGFTGYFVPVIPTISATATYVVSISRDDAAQEVTYSVNGAAPTVFSYAGADPLVSQTGGTLAIGGNQNAAGIFRGDIFDVRIWDFAKPISVMNDIAYLNRDDTSLGDELAHYRLREVTIL